MKTEDIEITVWCVCVIVVDGTCECIHHQCAQAATAAAEPLAPHRPRTSSRHQKGQFADI